MRKERKLKKEHAINFKNNMRTDKIQMILDLDKIQMILYFKHCKYIYIYVELQEDLI